jgi:hypothetical protein
MKARPVAICIADLPIFGAIGLNGPAMVRSFLATSLIAGSG